MGPLLASCSSSPSEMRTCCALASSCSHSNRMARPLVPNRPVRPTRCKYVDKSRGGESWITSVTRPKSTPRASKSVATSTLQAQESAQVQSNSQSGPVKSPSCAGVCTWWALGEELGTTAHERGRAATATTSPRDLPTYLPTYLLTYLAYLPTYLPTATTSPRDLRDEQARLPDGWPRDGASCVHTLTTHHLPPTAAKANGRLPPKANGRLPLTTTTYRSPLTHRRPKARILRIVAVRSSCE